MCPFQVLPLYPHHQPSLPRRCLFQTFLLLRCKRCQGLFQLQGTDYKAAVAEIGNNLITLADAALFFSGALVQNRKFICPSLTKIPLQKFLQYGNLLIDIHILLFVQLVLQKVAVRIPGRNIDKSIVELQRMNIIFQLQMLYVAHQHPFE